jgi:hypothetical protein
MIDVPVGEQDIFQTYALAIHRLHEQFEIATRVDHGGFARCLTPNEGAVLLVGSDGDDGEFHV